jgi:hypothetical protein
MFCTAANICVFKCSVQSCLCTFSVRKIFLYWKYIGARGYPEYIDQLRIPSSNLHTAGEYVKSPNFTFFFFFKKWKTNYLYFLVSLALASLSLSRFVCCPSIGGTSTTQPCTVDRIQCYRLPESCEVLLEFTMEFHNSRAQIGNAVEHWKSYFIPSCYE